MLMFILTLNKVTASSSNDESKLCRICKAFFDAVGTVDSGYLMYLLEYHWLEFVNQKE
jgi:hypothetical protein